jgi:PBSX family phage portal protein
MSNFRKPFAYVTKTGTLVRQDILDQYVLKSKQLKQIDAFGSLYKNLEIVEPLYNPYALANLLELNTYHARCVKTKARDTAGLGWTLKALVDEPSEKSLKLKEHIIEVLKDMPMSILEVLDRACTDFESVAWGAMEIVRADHDVDGELAQLAHLPSPDLRVHRDGNKYVQIINTQQRWFKRYGYEMDVHMDDGSEYPLGQLAIEQRATEVLFWTNYSPRSSYYGLPDIIPAIGALQGDLSRRDYNISFFDNFGVPAYAVFITGNFDPGEPVDDDGNPDPTGKTALEREIEGHFDEIAKNPHSVLILSLPSVPDADGEVKIEFVPLAKEVREASFRLYRLDNRDEVIAAHGVPLNRLGINEIGALSGQTASESTEVYKTSVIGPRQDTIQTLINRAIIWGMFEAYDWAFTLDPIDTTDETHDVEIAGSVFKLAALTPNDIIRNFGTRFGAKVSDHPAMNAHYLDGVPVDYIPEAGKYAAETAPNAVKMLTDAGVPLEDALLLVGYEESDVSRIVSNIEKKNIASAEQQQNNLDSINAQSQQDSSIDNTQMQPNNNVSE